MDNFEMQYEKLREICEEILAYYDIDKIKPYSVYIWTKGKNSHNVFDIQKDEIIIYDKEHDTIQEAKPIIQKIQLQLQKINDM